MVDNEIVGDNADVTVAVIGRLLASLNKPGQCSELMNVNAYAAVQKTLHM